jgi:hypothetical protein
MATPSAPPEIREDSKSGTLLAALKTSSSKESPNYRLINVARPKPNILSIPKKKARMKEERARCDISILGSGLSMYLPRRELLT